MIVVSNRGSRDIDRRMIEEKGLPGAVLMEGAALACLRLILRKWTGRRDALILAGRGNNGGDGLALARMLHNRNLPVRVLHLGEEGLSPEAALQRNVLKQLGVPVEPWREGMSLGAPDLLVDALLGTGFRGTLEGPVRNLVEAANALASPTLRFAIDIPTGMNGDDGSGSPVFDADVTLALGYPKPAHLLSERLRQVWLARLEFDPALAGALPEEEVLHALLAPEAAALLPPRPLQGHKGLFGRVGVLGGKTEMSGATLLAGKAALRTGTGLATAWVRSPERLLGLQPELMLESWDGFLNKELDVLAIGPGLGREDLPDLEGALTSFGGTILLDADALHLLKDGRIHREWIRGPLVLTPHPGEARRLLDGTEGRKADVLELARRYRCTAVLKGWRTLISDGRQVHVNLTGNPGMATAGSGDVLTGVLASLLGQGMEPLPAAVLGCHLHGLAGDLAARTLGERSLLAGDLAEALPGAFRRLENLERGLRDIIRIDRHEEGAVL